MTEILRVTRDPNNDGHVARKRGPKATVAEYSPLFVKQAARTGAVVLRRRKRQGGGQDMAVGHNVAWVLVTVGIVKWK